MLGKERDTMKLWIGTIAPGTTDEEIREFVKKYAPALECTAVQRADGDGSRPAAILEFSSPPAGAIETISMRLNGMYWKDRALVVQTMLR